MNAVDIDAALWMSTDSYAGVVLFADKTLVLTFKLIVRRVLLEREHEIFRGEKPLY
jgi:hypothetical protein